VTAIPAGESEATPHPLGGTIELTDRDGVQLIAAVTLALPGWALTIRYEYGNADFPALDTSGAVDWPVLRALLAL